MSISDLRASYPWPNEKPDVPERNHGWFSGRAPALARWSPSDFRTIMELGSWLGHSATWFCDTFPNADVICVDHWQGSKEHTKDRKLAAMLPVLYETFLVNMWKYRNRIVPVRENTADGLAAVHAAGVKPDLIYVDAGHDEESVYADVHRVIELFPQAQIVGDDWPHKPVQQGIKRAIAGTGYRLLNQNRVWWLEGKQ